MPHQRGELISKAFRFVVDPEGWIVPDIAEKLSGRGVWLRSGRAAIVFHARNGSKRGRERLAPARGGIPVVTLFKEAELSLALGRESMVHAAVTVCGFTDHVLREVSRLDGVRTSDGQTTDELWYVRSNVAD